MELYKIVILSIVEGITEFLPVSSTFHLILTSHILGIAQNDFAKLFEVFIQSGAILSIVIIYGLALLKDRTLFFKVTASFVPTAVVGLILYKVIKGVFFEANMLMAMVFFAVGILFLAVEYFIVKDGSKLKRNISSINYQEAITIGLVQSFAVVPGVSRAGAVIILMILLGFRRDEAAKYSFLLSIPTIFAASFLDLFKMRGLIMAHPDYLLFLGLGFVITFATSFIVVKWLLGYLKTNSLAVFGWYRIGLVALLFILGALKVFRFM